MDIPSDNEAAYEAGYAAAPSPEFNDEEAAAAAAAAAVYITTDNQENDSNGYNLGAYNALLKDLSGVDLSGWDLSTTDLANITFFNTNLMGTAGWDLSTRNLANITFFNTNLMGTNRSESNLMGAELNGAQLTNVYAIQWVECPEALPSEWFCIANCLVGPGANLSGAQRSLADLGGIDMPGANFANADLNSAVLTHSDLTEANFSNAALNYANLMYADLYNADLTGSDVTGVIGSGALCPDGSSSGFSDGSCCGHLNGAVVATGCEE